ncbi:MAG: low molecular weight phosphotyrosine protein phosphatase [Eubacterium sp.]|nr:low molecular weight phosphotyrosine protein phosphatase [Eubacterium sp.]
MIKVLFVCHGNICRSPMAEFILKDMVGKAGLEREFHIESRATHTDEIWGDRGNPVYPPARKKLAEAGISCAGKTAELLVKSDYMEYDYIIGMDSENMRWMPRILGGDPEGKISLLMDYTDRPGNVADPWYTRNFDATFRDVVEGCEGFLQYLKMSGKLYDKESKQF